MTEEFDIDEVEEGNWEDLFNGEYEKKNHPFEYFVNYKLFKENTIFGYYPYQIIFRFPYFLWNRISDFIDQIRWAWQRVFRGWDDRVVWSIDYWLDPIMPDILSRYKKVNHGTPMSMFDEFGLMNGKTEFSDEEHNMANEKWNFIIDRIIDGFKASQKLKDAYIKTTFEDYKKEVKELERERRKGMILFVKYYNDIWD